MKLLRDAWLVAGRELRSFFVSPIAYVALSGFALLVGWIFFNLLARYVQISGIYFQLAARDPSLLGQLNLHDLVLQPTFLNMTVILVILFPMLTMRLLAEERRQHTDELLLTSPLSTGGIVLGKFLAVMGVFLAMLLLTGTHAAILAVYGEPAPGVGEFVSAYLGLLLMGMAFGSVGVFTSALTSNQIVAAVSAFVVLLLLYVIDWIAASAGGTVGEVLQYISLTRRYQDFVKGIVDLKSVVYFLSFTVMGLYLAKLTLDTMRVRS